MIEYRALQKAGRRSSGHNGDHGSIAHAVPRASYRALCGTEPSGSGDWSSYDSESVTCPKCLRKLNANDTAYTQVTL